jgi:ribosome-binding factor A
MKVLPDLEFEEDETERTAERIESLMRELHTEDAEEGGS